MSTTALVCGCISLAGGGVVSRCHRGQRIWDEYLTAVETETGNHGRWFPLWPRWERHLSGQEDEAWAC